MLRVKIVGKRSNEQYDCVKEWLHSSHTATLISCRTEGTVSGHVGDADEGGVENNMRKRFIKRVVRSEDVANRRRENKAARIKRTIPSPSVAITLVSHAPPGTLTCNVRRSLHACRFGNISTIYWCRVIPLRRPTPRCNRQPYRCDFTAW